MQMGSETSKQPSWEIQTIPFYGTTTTDWKNTKRTGILLSIYGRSDVKLLTKSGEKKNIIEMNHEELLYINH
jgi:hypothetical protein